MQLLFICDSFASIPFRTRQTWYKHMNIVDIFAWIVLVVLILSTVGVIVFLAMLPGIVAKRRAHPWVQAVTVAGWVTLFLGFALWPLVLIWAYVDVPRVGKVEDAR